MIQLNLPWLELAIVTPLVGAILAAIVKDAEKCRQVAIVATGSAMFFAIGAWQDFHRLKSFEAIDRWDIVSPLLGPDAIVIDELSAPLIALTSLQFFLVALATLRTKVRRFPFAANMLLECLMLTTLCCRRPWGIIVLLAIQCVPIYCELRARGRSTRVFLFHMITCVALTAIGWAMIDVDGAKESHSVLAIGLLTAGILLRSGSVPGHCWMTDLFEKATLGTSILFVTPLMGGYCAVRMLLPISPDWALRVVALVALFTAVYSAGMALVQVEIRRFFTYLLLSNMSLVFVGLEVVNAIGLTGALCAWLSVGLTLMGFGLTLRAIESRVGRLSLRDFHGLYGHMPMLAVFFLLTGLASVGFPGTIGFVAIELLLEGVIQVYPVAGVLLVVATTLNGIAIVKVYFRVFTGTEHTSTFSLLARWPERVAILTLSLLIVGGGVFPQPGVTSRYHAAKEIMLRRGVVLPMHETAALDSTIKFPQINNEN